MFRIYTIFCLLLLSVHAFGYQSEKIKLEGIVYSNTDKEPLPGALISLENESVNLVSDAKGHFVLELPKGKYTIKATYIGFSVSELEIQIPYQGDLAIYLEEDGMDMEEFEVFSTGYQEIPKERATGSFAQLDQTLVDRRVSTNIIDRLEDLAPGLVFNRDTPSEVISIRGRNTIFGDNQPLIIIDNFPYDGPLENINPNDVESITVLRDAAAASIWGAKAGNGVIVISTKKGKVKQDAQLTFTSNTTFQERTDLFYAPRMNVDEFVNLERTLFDRGIFDSEINSIQRTALSPVIETLLANRQGLIGDQETDLRLQAYSAFDNRQELSDMFERNGLQLQNAINIRGGGQQSTYSYSLGHDKNYLSRVGSKNERITLAINNSWEVFSEKLKVSTAFNFTKSSAQAAPSPGVLFPYERIMDLEGNQLPITRGYNRRFVSQAETDGLLNWDYFPIREREAISNQTNQNDIRANLGLTYKILPNLNLSANYQYWENQRSNQVMNGQNSYFVRDLINQFTQRNQDGSFSRAVPMGGILDQSNSRGFSHHGRIQLGYNGKHGEKGEFNALAGYEIKSLQQLLRSNRFYGYNDEFGQSIPVDYVTTFRRYHNNSLANIPTTERHSGISDRFLSAFFNAAYTYDRKYILSASARKDQSNLFGVETNQRGVPLWSVGAGWVISEESFYNFGWLPYLKFRSTYGYNGNAVKSISALTTAVYFIQNTTLNPNLQYAAITNPPNPDLRWERIKILNLGLDFESKNGRFSGYFEVYNKQGLDLIGDRIVPGSSGMTNFRGNFADTRSRGIDLLLTTKVIDRKLSWVNSLIFSHINEKVTSYGVDTPPRQALSDGFVPPVPGKPLFAVFSLPSAGLDPANGDPRGFVDGEPSSNYGLVFDQLTFENINYHGSSRPTFYGALRNDLSWKNLSLSVNVSYRMGYYYRRNSIAYGQLFAGRISHEDYSNRWQNPGDENTTYIPSLPQFNNFNRNEFFRFSEHLVERADHIRLQDIRLSYNFFRSQIPRLPFRSVELYGYANNIGILWKSSDEPIDPDFQDMRPLRTYSMGLRIQF